MKTKAEIHKLIYGLAQEGKSIVLISSDIPELVQIADRILVFRDGTIVSELDNEKNYEAMSEKILSQILV